MAEQFEEKVSFDGKKVKVLGPTFEEGKPEIAINWRQKMRNRDEMLAYLWELRTLLQNLEAQAEERKR